MSARRRESRPAGNRAAASSRPISDANIVAPAGLQHPKAVAPGYVVFVLRKDRAGWRRQVYVSLSAANRAVDRAEVNGVECRVQLVELVPVSSASLVVVGDDR